MKNTEPLLVLNKMKTEVLFLRNSFKSCVVKCNPDPSGEYIKFKGLAGLKAKDGSKFVADAILTMDFITEKEYEEF